MSEQGITIRLQALTDGLAVVDFVHAEFFALELEDQGAGIGDILLALDVGVVVGRVLLRWRYQGNGPEVLRGQPYLERLSVREGWQRRGIGTALMRAAERRAVERGITAIGIGVAVGNDRARALYEREGYRLVDAPPLTVSWPWPDDEGVERIVSETIVFLQKPLAASRPHGEP